MHFPLNLLTLGTLSLSLLLFGSTTAITLHTKFQYRTNGTWLENLALGPAPTPRDTNTTQTLLVTRMDVPELWKIDVSTGQGEVVATFPNATACMGVTPLAREGVYAAVAGRLQITDIGHPVVGSWGVYSVDISGGDAVSVHKIADVPEAGWLNGVTFFPSGASGGSGLVLMADSVNGVIWQLDTQTGKYSVALNDTASMAASPTDPLGLGVNGVRVWRGFVYYSTDSVQAVFRVPVRWDDSLQTVRAAGAVETVAEKVVVDDFAVAEDGGLYLMAVADNQVVSVTAAGQRSVLAGVRDSALVAGCTSAVVSRDGRRLFVTTNGGHITPPRGREEPAKLVEIVL
ncbi:hypothetical protein ASPACDRAFT_60486 [Aspergillus aculeatus ATCC 16872]|uniref:SMP-30/Gluconolactonase/LRE-like region domain-containing protein n=1 Tax=Aspergillus aculeatus (strain ATCC 16872 / CBS 172.66 / WB 5094) TaxID=690307 RepID=A0A1L9WU37_ASPA1|nr:uncharacterized protein ASPACDRAFT_60486 [Aspergillus aculeatus ATCC 16872]OJJ99648.1 hypothetical protein ASPACDRAFT_60486 [Aspergillus aculeatus ATCC 16872]